MTALYILAAAAALALIYLFLVFPSLKAKRCRGFFSRGLFAHRGLFDNEKIPENSLAAFSLAAERGYGIELDTHITSDGKIIVFHDDDMKRMCGKDSRPEDMTYGEISALRLLGTNEQIPEFSEVLKVIGGRVPVIVEIKGRNSDMDVCAGTAMLLDSYAGAYCVESFNPLYMRWFKKNRPDVIRGQLSCRMKGIMKQPLGFMLENLLTDFMSRPDFIAYDIKDSDKTALRIAIALGAYPVAWTVRSEKEHSDASELYKSFIFEKFEPPF